MRGNTVRLLRDIACSGSLIVPFIKLLLKCNILSIFVSFVGWLVYCLSFLVLVSISLFLCLLSCVV